MSSDVFLFPNNPIGEGLATEYRPLKLLLECHWEDNPKLHQDDAIQNSINTHGFNDPVGFDELWKLVLEGHGRTSNLEMMRAAGKPAPQHILVDGDTGEWWVPVVIKHFPRREQALVYALAHNRTNTSVLASSDYDLKKLARAKQTVADAQLALDGFGDNEMLMMGSGTTGQFELPALKPFDSNQLPDTAKVESGAPQAFTVTAVFRTYMQMKKAVQVLTFGARAGVSLRTTEIKFDGVELLDLWAQMLNGESASVKPARPPSPAPLLDGVQMLDTMDEEQEAQGASPWDLVAQQQEGEVGTPSNVGAKAAAAFGAPTEEKKPKAKKASSEKPRFKGGLCVECGGSKFIQKASKKDVCWNCLGLGTEQAYNTYIAAKEGELVNPMNGDGAPPAQFEQSAPPAMEF